LVKCADKRLLQQANNMLNLTSDVFIFIYTNQGMFVVPAFDVQLSGKRSVNADEFLGCPFGDFYKQFLTCFIGDHKIAPAGTNLQNLVDFARDIHVDTVLAIEARVEQRAVL